MTATGTFFPKVLASGYVSGFLQFRPTEVEVETEMKRGMRAFFLVTLVKVELE